jgi:hypothetical protein
MIRIITFGLVILLAVTLWSVLTPNHLFIS